MRQTIPALGTFAAVGLCGSRPLPGRSRSRWRAAAALLFALALLGGQAAPAQNQPAPQPDNAAGAAQNAPLLPPGFRPPREVPAVMTIEKELMSEKEEDELGKELRIKGRYPSVLTEGQLTNENRALLERVAKWRVHRLSLKKYRKTLPSERASLLREVGTAASRQANPTLARNFRESYLQQIVARCEELLDGNFHVRLNAVLILSEINILEAKDNAPEEAYTPALELLLKVLADKDQHEAIKVNAAKGLERISLLGQPSTDQRLRIATTLIAELQRKDTHTWYQQRLAESLGAVDLSRDLQQRPFIADALAKVMVDTDRHCLVRCEAARSLGRIPLDPSVNVSVLAFGVARLAHQLAAEHDKNPKAVHWPACYFKLYLAFRPRDAASGSRGEGLLTKTGRPAYSSHNTAVSEAYQQVLPLTRHALNARGTPFPKAVLDPGAEWLKKNQPDNFQVAPNLPPIIGQQLAGPDGKPAG